MIGAANVFVGALLLATVPSDRSMDRLIPDEVAREIARLDAEDPAVRIQAIRQLQLMGRRAAPAVGKLVRLLTAESAAVPPGKLRQEIAQEALNALIAIGPPAVEPLIAALQRKRWTAREAAAKAFGSIADQRAAAPLQGATADPVWEVRKAAREAMAKLGQGDPRAPAVPIHQRVGWAKQAASPVGRRSLVLRQDLILGLMR